VKKLTLSELQIKSFITEYTRTDLITIKAGLFNNAETVGSDGPPTTSSSPTEFQELCTKHLPCSEVS